MALLKLKALTVRLIHSQMIIQTATLEGLILPGYFQLLKNEQYIKLNRDINDVVVITCKKWIEGEEHVSWKTLASLMMIYCLLYGLIRGRSSNVCRIKSRKSLESIDTHQGNDG
jgi:hypothetical protein